MKDKKKLENLGIKALILFGSQAQGIAGKMSDYDVFVIGPKNKKNYDVLYDFLSERIKKLVNIDIVFESEATAELKYHVTKYGRVLFQQNPSVFLDFKQKTMLEYADFAPLRAIFQGATLARINS